MFSRLISSLVSMVFLATLGLAETELFVCSESGQGPAYVKICVSDTGNVTLFESPKGQEHIRYIIPGAWSDYGSYEGYMLCRVEPEFYGLPPYQTYYDAGGYYPRPIRNWRMGWNPAYRIDQPNGSNKFPLILHQRTSDGRFELKQEFSVDGIEREVTITMTLYNRSGQRQRDVRLVRAVDLDIDTTGEQEDSLLGKRTVVEYDYGPPYGANQDAVSLSAPSSGYTVFLSSLGFDEYDLGAATLERRTTGAESVS